MSSQIAVLGETIEVVRYRGEPVVTFAMVDRVHQRVEGTAGRTFRENRERFVEGVDFIELTSDEVRRMSASGVFPERTARGILLTRRGYLKLVKPLTDDRAWEVQGEMIERYFAVEEIGARLAAAEARIAALEGHRLRPRRALPATIDLPLPDEEAARMLLDWIGCRGGEIAARDILRLGPNAVRDQVARDRAIAILIGEGRLFEIGHRPRRLRLLS